MSPFSKQLTGGRSGKLVALYSKPEKDLPYYIEENSYPTNSILFPTIAQGSITSRVKSQVLAVSHTKGASRSRREDFLVVPILEGQTNSGRR